MRVQICEVCKECEPTVWWHGEGYDLVLCVQCWSDMEVDCEQEPVDVLTYTEVGCD